MTFASEFLELVVFVSMFLSDSAVSKWQKIVAPQSGIICKLNFDIYENTVLVSLTFWDPSHAV